MRRVMENNKAWKVDGKLRSKGDLSFYVDGQGNLTENIAC